MHHFDTADTTELFRGETLRGRLETRTTTGIRASHICEELNDCWHGLISPLTRESASEDEATSEIGLSPRLVDKHDDSDHEAIAFSLTPSGADIRYVPSGMSVQRSERYPNKVCTTRFTWLTWLPTSLLLQFRRIANIFFLLISISTFMEWSPKPPAPVVGPFALILLLTAIRDMVEDRKRAHDDMEENTQLVQIYETEERVFKNIEWQDCKPGDVLLIKKDEAVPVDILLAASHNAAGISHISTANLDGETNLKQKHVPVAFLNATEDIEKPKKAAEVLVNGDFTVKLNPPTMNLTVLEGTAQRSDQKPSGLDVSNFALRGSTLRNTRWVIGVACFVGEDTKVRLNAIPARYKVSDLHHAMNRVVILNIAMLIAVSFYMAIGASMQPVSESHNHSFPLWLWIYVMIMYYVMPISVYLFVELLKIIIAHQIEGDEHMRDPESQEYAAARTTDLVEELGQLHFVFSDKTGTLTANEMRFAWACVGEGATRLGPFLPSGTGRVEGIAQANRLLLPPLGERPAEQTAVLDFFNLLAVCHLVKLGDDDEYEGESPDEVALVRAAQSVGIKMVSRQERGADEAKLVVEGPEPGKCEEWQIAHVLRFSSERKRMSVICKTADGGALVLTKGADSVMEKRLVAPLSYGVSQAINDFSRLGLRTLIAARRKMDAATYSKWKAKSDDAHAETEDRAAFEEAVAEEAETEMEFVGVTALEDRLQEGVLDTIMSLKAAQIRFWVLTGDKVETALEIAKNCGVFTNDSSMQLFMLTKLESLEDVERELRSLRRELRSEAYMEARRGLVLDGESLSHIFQSEKAQQTLYDVSLRCRASVACRLSPNQKHALIGLICKHDPYIVTAAIGDGANDVPMILGAHVGIGLRGKEGPASVQACDVAISKFQYLRNLVLGHGRRSYRRVALFLCFYPYKQWVMAWGDVIYAQSTSFMAKPLYSAMLLTLSCIQEPAILCVLGFDSDIVAEDDDATAHMEARLYRPGPARLLFNLKVFAKWMLSAFWHGTVTWLVPAYFMTTQEDLENRTPAFWGASLTAFTLYLLITYLFLLWNQRRQLNVRIVGAVCAAFCVYMIIVVFLAYGPVERLAPELRGVPGNLIKMKDFWICLAVVPVIAITPNAVVEACGWCAGGCKHDEQSSSDEAYTRSSTVTGSAGSIASHSDGSFEEDHLLRGC